MNGLDSPEAHQFYNGFVNGLKKQRYNIASNVEAVEFGKDSLLLILNTGSFSTKDCH